MSIPTGSTPAGMPQSPLTGTDGSGFSNVPGSTPSGQPVAPAVPGQSQTAMPGQTQAPGQATAPAAPGQTQVPGQPAQTTAPGQPVTTATGTTTLPRTEQPIQDQISQAGQIPQTIANSYTATTQLPVLPKPVETKPEKQDKKAEKETNTGNTDNTQQSDGTVQVDGEHKAHQDQEGGQGGGGGSGGNPSSDSGGSGSGGFTGGGDQSSKGHGNSSLPNLDGSKQTIGTMGQAATVGNIKATIGPDGVETAQTQEAAYAQAIDPLGVAVISESGLFSPPVNGAQFFDNGAKIMQEIAKMNASLAASMPDGPDKMRFMDFLKVVQDALNQFQQLLRELQLNDSKGAQDRSKAQLEASLQKIEDQREQQAEMAKKSDEAAKKAKIMGPLAVLFAFLLAVVLLLLMVVFLAVVMMTLPPLGMLVMTLIAAEFVDQCATAAGKKPFAIQAIANLVMSFVESLVDSWNTTVGGTSEDAKAAKAALKTITVAIVMIVSTLVAPAVILFGGVTALLSFLSASHVVKDAAMESGMPEEEATKVEMYVGIAVGVVYAVAALAVAFVLPVGGVATAVTSAIRSAARQAAQLVTQILAYLINMTDKVASKVARTIQSIFKTLMNPELWVNVTGLGLQTTNAVTTYNYQHILADIALIQGKMDADIELKDATIQMLKKMIKQLLDGLNGIADDIAAVGQSLKKTHASVSQISSDIFG